jgi:hypothetical protein
MNAILRQAHRIIRNAWRDVACDSSGITLVELMVATAILSIAVLGMVGAFGGIQKAIQISKNKTLAANLAQEKMQILGQLNYYQVLATPSPSFYAIGASSVPYDTTYFPAETILEGGVTYTRMTYIQVAVEVSSAIVVLPPSTPDTGMRLVTINVVWTQSGQVKSLALNSIISNPNTVENNSIFSGTVKDTNNNAISGALVELAENMGWAAKTNASGNYSIPVSAGNFTMVVSASGYYTQILPVSIAADSTATESFTLTKIATGTAAGTAWLNPDLVISSVVGTTYTCTGSPCTGANLNNVEYVELYNPTTVQINVVTPNSAGSASPWLASNVTENYKLNTTVSGSPNNDIMTLVPGFATYVSSYVVAGGYYLLGSYQQFMVNGAWVTPDAYWSTTGSDYIADYSWGGVQLKNSAGTLVDRVCWNGTGVGGPPNSWCGTTFVPTSAACGLNTGEPTGSCTGSPYEGNQLVRYSSSSAQTGGFLGRGTYGSAYKSGFNDIDFSSPSASVAASLGLNSSPFVSAHTFSPALKIVSGIAAAEAWISASDGLSSPVQATSPADVAGASATFALTGIATGTWSVYISSSGYLLENDTVTVTATAMSTASYVFPSSATILSAGDVVGFIAGTVLDVLGVPVSVSPYIQVSPGGAGANTTASTVNGRYVLRVTPGSVDVTANPSGGNSTYVSVSSLAVTAILGQVHDNVNFVLSQGGQISGFVTRDGINGLPGIAVAALDANGYAHDTEITNNAGYFTTIIMSTGVYDMTPELDSVEYSSPTYYATTVGSGQTVFSTTFTVSGALGTISGTVTAGSKTISTGVLIVVTTTSLSGTPPAPPTLSSTTLTSNSYYITSSLEDGSYSLGVRQSTITGQLYNAYGYYTTVSSTGGVTIQSQLLQNISVTAGASVTGKNFAW